MIEFSAQFHIKRTGSDRIINSLFDGFFVHLQNFLQEKGLWGLRDFQVVSGNLIHGRESIHGFQHNRSTGNDRNGISVFPAYTDVVGNDILTDHRTNGVVNQYDIILSLIALCNII